MTYTVSNQTSKRILLFIRAMPSEFTVSNIYEKMHRRYSYSTIYNVILKLFKEKKLTRRRDGIEEYIYKKVPEVK